MKKLLSHILFIVILFFSKTIFAQENAWTKASLENSIQGISLNSLDSDHYSLYNLDIELIKKQLMNTPLRSESRGVSNINVTFPDETGKAQTYRIVETAVLAEDVAKLYPNIKTYLGFRTDNSGTRIRFSVTPLGLTGVVSVPGASPVFIQPVSELDKKKHLVYSGEAKLKPNKNFKCLTEDISRIKRTTNTSFRGANDQSLRTFRIAVSVHGEFTSRWDDGDASTGTPQEDALSKIVATINRINEVFEVDMAITFQLINGVQYNGNDLIFDDAATDPYVDEFNLNAELQNTLTTVVGEANYDIGHLFLALGETFGNAGCIGCVCKTGKGSGIASHTFEGNNNGPYMDDYFDTLVAHEIGHQMGANHTFSHLSEGTGVNSEPGSGTTIMSYAGITGASNVQNHIDPYFHYHSIKQILSNSNVVGPTSCATTTPITNNPPVANAGPDYAIPNGTAFILKANATDADAGDTLTYTWEQLGSGVTSSATFSSEHLGPVWRSRPPSTNPERYMPVYSRVLARKLTETNPTVTTDNSSWETVSTVARALNFGLTVRDHSVEGGTGQTPQSDFDEMTVNVEAGEPFTVVSPSSWTVGDTVDIVWNVGTTNNTTINCQNVTIKFSTDGGVTFPTTLVANTPNDGSETITVPSFADADNARLLVEAVDNIFYALSNNFLLANGPTFGISSVNNAVRLCNKEDSISYDINYIAVNGFNETTTFSASGIPQGFTVSFSPATLSADGITTMTIDGLNGTAAEDYTITVNGVSASVAKALDVSLSIIDGLCPSRGNTGYATSTTLVQFGTIDNASAKPSGYSDYTSISTNVEPNQSYTINLHQNTDGDFITVGSVWIDWNQNCLIEVEESYNLGTAANTADGPTSNSPLTVVVPADAVIGSTLMRVSTKYNSPATPCLIDFDGEVEDYTVNVKDSPLSTDAFDLEALLIYPNPNNGVFNLKFNTALAQEILIDVFDIRGRTVFNKLYNNNLSSFNHVIDLGAIESGIYMLQISDGVNKQVKRIVVK